MSPIRVQQQRAACRYVDGFGYYLPSHERDCDDHACDGCEPCTERHCTARKPCTGHLDHAHPLTCPRCVGRTRADLREVVRLSGLMLDEAIEAGVDSEAAMLAGPAADPEASMWRRLASVEHLADIAADDDRHPLTVLGTWDMMLREDYEQPTGLRCTIGRAADYLDGQLQRLAQDDEQDFPLFASEIRACRSHLEDVLTEGQRRETGAPCPACSIAPPLVKRWFTHAHDMEQDPNEPCRACEQGDSWHCPACKAAWNEADYRKWVADDYLDNAEELTAADIELVTGIKANRVRVWAIRGHVDKRGRNTHGITLYDVGQAKRRAEMEDACVPACDG